MNDIDLEKEFVDLCDNEFGYNNTRDIIKELFNRNWLCIRRIRWILVKNYYYFRLKDNGGNAKEARLDVAVAYNVSEDYVKTVIYKHRDIN